MDATEPKLKPCPFCGATGLLETASNHAGWSMGSHWTATCPDDECFAFPVVVVGKTEFEAIRRWNIRAGGSEKPESLAMGAPDAALVEALTQIVEFCDDPSGARMLPAARATLLAAKGAS